jgi:hypothetical protein
MPERLPDPAGAARGVALLQESEQALEKLRAKVSRSDETGQP